MRHIRLGLLVLPFVALVHPGMARAELVTTRADQGVLAAAADGTPYVAYTVGRALFVSVRDRGGAWRAIQLGRLPAGDVNLDGIAVSERPHRYVSVLTEDRNGRWLVLARGSRLTTIARASPGSSYGPAGLTLDAHERPAVAFAVRRPSGHTFLRLVTVDSRARPHARAITKQGFPFSDVPPAAAPVVVAGRLHVVETYTSAAIDWGPSGGHSWEGQFLFASSEGTPQGRAGAVFVAPTLWSAWTQVSADTVVLLTSSADTQTTWTLTHGVFVGLAQGEHDPEVAAYDWATSPAGWFTFAGLVIRGPGNEAWQLDGRLAAYTIDRAGTRQLLLYRNGELEWFRAPAPGLPGIAIRMAVDAAGQVTGSVVGQSGGVVRIYRELPHFARELVTTAPVAADGTYKASVPPPGSDVLYRAVYEDPVTGIPFGFLPGVPVGVSG